MNREREVPPIRWGILGLGKIAHLFTAGLQELKDHQLVACASRSLEKAEEFSRQWSVRDAHGSYEALAQNPEVDVIYVATPHPYHRENTILCLKSGKAVLCEKPFALNARESEEMIAVARAEKRFLMEAMWMRFLPPMMKIKSLIQAGAIGDLRMIQASFGYRVDWDPECRSLNPKLGGGALLDVGIYPLSLAFSLLGKPQEIRSLAHLGKTGVDEQGAILLGYSQGEIAMLSSAVRTTTPYEAVIMGSEGMIRIHSQWWAPSSFTLSDAKGDHLYEFPQVGNGYQYEAEEVGRSLRAGVLESSVISWNESLEIMKTMDLIRKEWGFAYPSEQ